MTVLSGLSQSTPSVKVGDDDDDDDDDNYSYLNIIL